MKSNNKFQFAAKLITALFILGFMLGSSSDPPNGRTGAPGDGVCSSCHSGNNFEGNIMLDGLPSEVLGGQTYDLTVSVNNTDGNAVRAGFQMLSLFDSNSLNAGDYTTSTADVGTATAGTKEYVEHRGPKNFSNNTAEWSFQWTAPNLTSEEIVLMFAAGNVANGSGATGDAIKFGVFSTNVMPNVQSLDASEMILSEPTCNGDADGVAQIIADGGTPPYSFAWSTGNDTDTDSNLAAGIYTVTVTDDASESVIVEFTMEEPDQVTIDAQITDPSCFGDADGAIDITPDGGSEMYSYLWSNGATTQDIENLTAGEYVLTVTDTEGCSAILTNVVNNPAALVVDVVTTPETGMDLNDGAADINIIGGTAPYDIVWSVSPVPDVDNLEPGSYSITVTDVNDCSAMVDFEITAFECDFIVDLNSTNVTCRGQSNGEASVDPIGFTQPLNIEWSNGESEFIFVLGLAPGDYAVTLTDGAGCVQVRDFEITEPEELTLQLEGGFDDCTDLTNNFINPIVQGGTPPYTFQWSNGSMDSTLNNVDLGNYELVISDANACSAAANFELMFVDNEFPDAVAVDSFVVYLDETGIQDLDPNEIDNGSTDNCSVDSLSFVEGGTIDCNNLGRSEYLFVAWDPSGNMDTTAFTLVVLDTISPTAICPLDIEVNTCDTIFYDMPVFMDNCSVDSVSIAEGLPSGSVFPSDSTKVTYFFYDAAGNFGCCSFNVIVTNDLEVSIDSSTNATSEAGGSIDISVAGGSGNYSYEWVLNDTLVVSTLQDVSNLDPGAYIVTVFDENGCFVVSESVLIELESSINEVNLERIKVFPNPASNLMTITAEEIDVKSVEILTLSGKVIEHNIMNARSAHFDVSNLLPGMYFVRLNTEEGTKVVKLMKQ